MASSWWSSSNDEFIDKVASRRCWELQRSVLSDTWTLSGAENNLEWRCVLTTGRPVFSHNQTWIRSINWVCPSLGWIDEQDEQHRLGTSLVITEMQRVLKLDVTQLENITEDSIRSGAFVDYVFPPILSVRGSEKRPPYEINILIEFLKSSSLKGLARAPEYLLDIDDPAGILDDELRQRIENWPLAVTLFGTQPVRLGLIEVSREGFCIGTDSWWDSEAALEHQIQLGIDLAVRLHRAQTSYKSARRVRLAKGGGSGP